MNKSAIPPERIERLLQQRCGAISDFHQLTEGLSSQAFGFRHNAAAYVVRINRSIIGFEKDAYVSRKFGSTGLPIPEVLDVDYIDDSHTFCISRRAPGVRLYDLNNAGLQRIAGPTARIMKAIAVCNLAGTTGFGRFDPSGVGLHTSWRDFLTSITDLQRFDWEKAGRSADMELVRKLFQLVANLSEYCPEERRLIHGDFGSYNVLTNGRHITAVIDWDLALFGDPLYEWANLFFWGEDRMDPVIQQLGSLTQLLRFQERLLCYQLRIGLQEIYESAIGENSSDLMWLTTRCMRIMGQTS